VVVLAILLTTSPWAAAKERVKHPSAPAKNSEDVYFVAYNVADLLMPLPSPTAPPLAQTTPGQTDATSECDAIVELISRTIRPTTWRRAGGPGSIAVLKSKLTIIVSQTRAAHEEIADLFEQLRRMQDIGISVDVRFVATSDKAVTAALKGKDARGGVIWNGKQVKQLVETLAEHSGTEVTVAPEIAMLNGQTLQVFRPTEKSDPRGQSFAIQTLVSNDRRFIRIWLAALPNQVLASAWLSDGETLVAELAPNRTKPKKATPDSSEAKPDRIRRLLLVTPRIVVKAEEEERLLTPAQ
jgi:septum formation topological specificity factor MinE